MVSQVMFLVRSDLHSLISRCAARVFECISITLCQSKSLKGEDDNERRSCMT